MDTPWIDTAPMILHSHVTEISHIGKNLYKEINLPIQFNRHPHKHNKQYKHDLDTIRHWLRQLVLKKSNYDLNHTPITESLICRRWLDKLKYSIFASLLFYHMMNRVIISFKKTYEQYEHYLQYIDDRNFFGIWVFYVEGVLFLLFYYCFIFYFCN
jgi:hypothetical protein